MATSRRLLHYLLALCLLASLCYAHSPYSSRSSTRAVDVFVKWIGQQELRPNRSPLIDSMNRYVGNPLGSPYCAAAVSYAYYKAGNPFVKSGLARNLRTKYTYSAYDVFVGKAKIYDGDILIWQKGETVNGHAAIAHGDWIGKSGESDEGNTSSGEKGSQSDGDGFWRRRRAISPTSYFRIKWITPCSKQ